MADGKERKEMDTKLNQKTVTGSGSDSKSDVSDGCVHKKEFVFVGKKRDVIQKGKLKITVNGRELAVFHRMGEFFALDHSCYHAGGPLSLGDIEDIEGKACIICPYHKYKIVLSTGEGLYYSFNPKNFSKPPELCSKGAKQRTHHVQVLGEDVFVALSDMREPRDSDYYSSNAFKSIMSSVQR